MDSFDLHNAAIVPSEFFERDSTVVARELLGKVLVSRTRDTVTGGRIVETEAYLGADDPGSHAGRVAVALGVTLADNGVRLGTGRIDLLDAPRSQHVAASGRIGLSAGHELQLRFSMAGNGYVSNGRIGPRPRKGARVQSER